MEVNIDIPIEFKRLFDNDWREAAVHGGRYSLKSHTVARFLLIKAIQEKTKIGCFREFQNSIADSSHQLLADLIEHYKLNDFTVTDRGIVNSTNGSSFIFKGLWHNEQNIKSTEGIDIAWVEEAQTVTTNSLEVLTPTIRKPGSKIIYTYNRLIEEDPVHKRLVIDGRPDTLIINVNYDIAIKYNWIPDVVLKEIEDDKKFRPGLYKHKWLGEPVDQERRIYRGWKMIDEIPHEARLERYGLDFGYTQDSSCIVAVYYYNGGWILDEEKYQKGMSNKDIADYFKIIDQYSKTLVIADSAEPKSIDEIRAYGINIQPCRKGKDSVRAGIQLVQNQPMSLTKRSLNARKEYQSYLWATNREGDIISPNMPEGGNDHFLDATRYALETLGRLKQEESYWDRIFKEELTPSSQRRFNKGL